MTGDLRIVVVGGTHVGYHMSERLHNRGHDVVIVEKDRERVEFLNDQYVATVIQGDGSRPSILEQAGLDRSDVIASLTDYGAMTNIGICMTAKHLEPDIKTVARIDHGEHEQYEGMIDGIVYPEELAANSAANEVIEVVGGGVRTIEEVTEDLELIQIEVTEDAPVAGKTLADISFPRGALVVIEQPSGEFPDPDTVMEPGCSYVMAVHADVADEVVRLLRG